MRAAVGAVAAVVSGGGGWLRLLAASVHLQGVNVQRWPVRCDPERGGGEHGDMRESGLTAASGLGRPVGVCGGSVVAS